MPQQDPLFFFSGDSASSVSAGEEPLDGTPVEKWANHMELTDKLDKNEPEPSNSASQPLGGQAACHEDDDLLDNHGLLE